MKRSRGAVNVQTRMLPSRDREGAVLPYRIFWISAW
jgi:hypothetical protein